MSIPDSFKLSVTALIAISEGEIDLLMVMVICVLRYFEEEKVPGLMHSETWVLSSYNIFTVHVNMAFSKTERMDGKIRQTA